MSKQNKSFVCYNCNYIAPKWLGKCPECDQWGTLELSITSTGVSSSKTVSSAAKAAPLLFDQIDAMENERIVTGIGEWDRVVGGGLMVHSLVVLTGDPGIGKSTLLLAIAHKIQQQYTVLYVATEESLAQVKERAVRLKLHFGSQASFSDGAQLESIIELAQTTKPDVLIIDSIQNCYIEGAASLPGSIGQLKEATFRLMRLAKEDKITVILTGHINKEGLIAGPKTMEHMVDAVFYLQGDERWQTRVLRSVKNRFGTVNELGFFEMTAQGLEQVNNINQHLMSELTPAAGSALVAIIEGSKPLLLELQALTVASKLNMPQRVISGIDQKQVMLIAAILEKYLKVKLSMQDIFFKVTTHLKTKAHGTDLGIALALLSTYFQQPLPEKSIAIGEISLTGNIKPANQVTLLIKEAETFGVLNFLIAKNQKMPSMKSNVIEFSTVYQLLELFR
ncbi:DNA repair protein RadA [bacterium]|nr:MAG: DNA repair protein RadA [bacterium]QQR61761.1 MAG: DNA repair protein RadA [bacterium]QQR62664.1 MAG: DNA repair protein RadA [bacterium]